MRIRSIHPNFWRSEDVSAMSWDTRLVFIGLWSYVDDNGVGRDVAKYIVADLFAGEEDPRDSLARVSRALQQLSEGGQITRYTVNGKPFLYIAAWSSWQRIDRPGKERYEPPASVDEAETPVFDAPPRQSRETPATGEGEKGRRGEEVQVRPSTGVAVTADPPTFAEFWSIYPHHAEKRKAEAAWTRASKRVYPGNIISGAIRYRDDPNREPQFTKHPTTWLNGDCWTDDPKPERRDTRAPSDVRAARNLSLIEHYEQQERKALS